MANTISRAAERNPDVPGGDHRETRLMLIRHAEVERRYQGVFGGRIDMDLSPRGHQQADALAGYLRKHQLDAAYASPMRRVQQTIAPLVAAGLPVPAIIDDLREVDFGDWTGLAWEEVEAKFGISAFAWLDQLESGGIANAECSRKLRNRVEPALRQILARHADQQVAVFCHGGVIRMALSILLGFSLPEMGCFEIEYASVTTVVWIDGKPRLEVANLTPWRDLAT